MSSLYQSNSGIVMPREDFEALTEAMTTVLRIGSHFAPSLIARLDDIDGDPDLESATDLEDDHTLSPHALGYGGRGPGCEVSDTGENAWVEWTSLRGSQKRSPNIVQDQEDMEDDDPDCGLDEGEPDFSKPLPGWGAGCEISDSDFEHDGREHEGSI